MARGSALLGLDVGTSSIKVAAFDLSGRPLSLRRGETPTERSAGGWAEHDVDELWKVCAHLIADVVSQLDGYTIEAVATASVGEAGVPVDARGVAVRPAIAWFDSRGELEAEWWLRVAGMDLVNRISGQPIDSRFGVNKLMWIREHENESFATTRCWLSLADLVTHRLAGVFATDWSLASRTMVFDQRSLSWSDDLLGLADLDASLFPTAYPSGTRVGSVGAEAATLTRLPVGTPVVTGGHDRLCGAFAARGREQSVVDSTGSAEAVVVPVHRYVERDARESGRVSCYADVVPGQYVLSTRVGYAGALVDWYRRQVRGEDDGSDHLTVDSEVRWPLSFSGLLVYPSFGRAMGPQWDPSTAAGAVFGLTLGHSRSAVVQALIEGVGYSLRANIEWLERLTGAAIPTIRVEGALVASRVWMQLKADITGRRIEGTRLDDPTALGAALLAGVGVGIYADCAAAQDAAAVQVNIWEADERLARTYAYVFENCFQRLPQVIGEINTTLKAADQAPVLGDPS